MAEEKDYKAMLKSNDEYNLAVELGLMGSDKEVKGALAYNTMLNKAQRLLKEKKLSDEEKSKLSDEQKALYEKLQKQAEAEKKADRMMHGLSEDKREGTLEIGSTKEEPQNDDDWIKQKRDFWEKYAEERGCLYNEEDKDNPSKTNLLFGLSKGEKAYGSISYSSPSSVQISKDSDLLMYQGLVRDAVIHNLSITFGESLDEKQKLMLYAAVLMEDKPYENGEKAEAINPPKIDLDSEIFQSLPNNVREVLTKQKKIEDMKENYEERKKQLAEKSAFYQTHPEKQANKDKSAVEKIQAARMGIIPEFRTEKGVTIKYNEQYATKKREQNPAYEAYLKRQFSKTKE